jgi:hypothetical protein
LRNASISAGVVKWLKLILNVDNAAFLSLVSAYTGLETVFGAQHADFVETYISEAANAA